MNARRWALIILALIITFVGTDVIYGGFGESIVKALYTQGNVPQQMAIEVLYFGLGMLFLCFAVTWVALAYTLRKLSIIKEGQQEGCIHLIIMP